LADLVDAMARVQEGHDRRRVAVAEAEAVRAQAQLPAAVSDQFVKLAGPVHLREVLAHHAYIEPDLAVRGVAERAGAAWQARAGRDPDRSAGTGHHLLPPP